MRLAAGLALPPFPSFSARRPNRARCRPEQQLAHDIYKELIEINTADSVGNTTTAANAVAKRFRDAGFPAADIFQGGPRPDKGNLIVRYHGNGTSGRKPLMLLAHLDVVQALKTDWSPDIDPFKFTERDGYYYGRGTSDDKAMGSIFIANLLRFKQEGYVPDRDIILVLTADEEGGPANGVRWLIANHRDKIDAAYALNEGGGGSLRDGKPFINSVGAAEKVSTNFTVTTNESRRTLVGPARRQRDLRALAGAGEHREVSIPGDAQRSHARVLLEHRENRKAGDGRRDARDRRQPERCAKPARRSRPIHAIARCCARPASRRCSPADTRATRCRRRRLPTSTVVWRPATIRRTSAPRC